MKKKDLYLDSGYLNFGTIYNLPHMMTCIIGARGIGKTYGALKYCIEHDKKFFFIRRTQAQADVIGTIAMNPFKKLNSDKGWCIIPSKNSKYVNEFRRAREEDGKYILEEGAVGYSSALSTFSNIRGFDASDIDVIIYDEFVPQVGERAIKGEADSFFNMIETINRNRELNGDKAVRVICMSNSTDVANPIFIELQIVTKCMKAQNAGEWYLEDKNRGLSIVIPQDSPISCKKKETELYKLTKGTRFYESSADNSFAYNVPTNQVSRPLKEYRPVASVGEITIYRHKNKTLYYVTKHRSGTTEYYGTSLKELRMFQKRHPTLRSHSAFGKVEYEDYSCEILFDKYTDFIYN